MTKGIKYWMKNHYFRSYFLLSFYFSLVSTTFSSIPCRCAHQILEYDCLNSKMCIWVNNRCQATKCGSLALKDCSSREFCHFNGERCISERECEASPTQFCSSHYCYIDQICKSKGLCSQYNTSSLCAQNRNREGKLCFWDGVTCAEIQQCNQIKIKLFTDDRCRQELSECTVDEAGYCTISPITCELHQLQKQCYFNRNKSIKCIWKLNSCFADGCELHDFQEHKQCMLFGACTTNGSSCIPLKRNCHEYENAFSCVITATQNDCLYYGGFCWPRSCDSAPQSSPCKAFGQNCIQKADGYCKQDSKVCLEYEVKTDCILNISCYWDSNYCRDKQCQDLDQLNCRTNFLPNCIFEQSQCMELPLLCTSILEEENCIKSKDHQECIWISNSCRTAGCLAFKYPEYDSIQKCLALKYDCVYKPFFGCINFDCAFLRSTDCSRQKRCRSQNCKTKSSSNFPLSLDSHSLCEGWHQSLTISSSGTCLLKMLACQDYAQASCHSTSEGYSCRWDGANCVYRICTDLPPSDCMTIKIFSQTCVFVDSICKQFKPSCADRSTENECNLTPNCVFHSSNCQDKSCNLAPITLTADFDCNNWLQDCIAQSGGGCKARPECTDLLLDTHANCNSANRFCTVKPRIHQQGCMQKLNACSDYLQANQCFSTSNNERCIWHQGACINLSALNCASQSSATTQAACESFSQHCKLNQNGSCIALKSSCAEYSDIASCNLMITFSNYGPTCTFYLGSCQLRACTNIGYALNQKQCEAMGSSCRLQSVGGSCIDRSSSCSGLSNSDCQSTLKKHAYTYCYWNGLACVLLPDCAIINSTSRHGCQKFNNNCDFDNNTGCITTSSFEIVNCLLATTQETSEACIDYHAFCTFNVKMGIGCTFSNCKFVPQAQCDPTLLLNHNIKCIFHAGECKVFQCSLLSSQPDCDANSQCVYNTTCQNIDCSTIVGATNHDQCSTANNTCTFTGSNVGCHTVGECSSFTEVARCIIDVDGNQCFWTGTNCKLKDCSDFTGASDNSICSNFLSGCVPALANSGCMKSCSSFPGTPSRLECIKWNSCAFDGSNCVQFELCASLGMVECLQHNYCFWDTSCLEKICSNFGGVPTFADCQTWLPSCVPNYEATGCIIIDACEQAPTSYSTHLQCEQFLSSCTLTISAGCTALPSECRFATDIQCYFDASGNPCIWDAALQICYQATQCSQLSPTLNTHSACNSAIRQCTVKNDLVGCAPLQASCTDYTIVEQCIIDASGADCIWFSASCQYPSCQTYSVGSCPLNLCILNSEGTICDDFESQCQNYNQVRCQSGAKNSQSVPCIWSITRSVCTEKICEDFREDDCSAISQSCFDSPCLTNECSDFDSPSDEECSEVLPNKRCTTNGIICVERAENCEKITNHFQCTYASDQTKCIWINSACYPLTCETTQRCSDFQNCVRKADSGCKIMQQCSDALDEITCIDGQPCVWDAQEEICLGQLCSHSCGDGIIDFEYETCDDGNQVPYDGCYQCQLQCAIGCQKCHSIQCIQCSLGYQLSLNGQCVPICGDMIVIEHEECDDGNTEDFDGCYECAFKCVERCETCEEGTCVSCITGYDGNLCRPVCGDGLKVAEEVCDDGNDLFGDGCSENCLEESGFNCDNNLGLTICLKIDGLDLVLSEVRCQSIKCQAVSVTFLNFGTIREAVPFEYSLQISQFSRSMQISEGVFHLIIEPQEQTNSYVLEVTSKEGSFVDHFGNVMQPVTAKIRIAPAMYLGATEKEISTKVNIVNQVLLGSLFGFAVFSYAIGNIGIFWNLLDILQELSYLKYINVAFPEQLQTYFALFDVFSIELIQSYLGLQWRAETYLPIIQPSGKLLEFNALYLANVQSMTMVISSSFFLYLLHHVLLKLFNYVQLDQIASGAKPSLFKMLSSFQKIQKQIFLNAKQFLYAGINRLVISCMNDILFSCLLQLCYPSFESPFFLFNYLLASFAMSLTMAFIFQLSSTLNKETRNFLYQPIYEGFKAEVWCGRQYQAGLCVKKLLFMLFLIGLQEEPYTQTLSISLLCTFKLLILLKVRPHSSRVEYLKLFIEVGVISLTTLTMLAYEVPSASILVKNIFGWLHVTLFTVCLTSPLALEVYQKLKINKSIANLEKDSADYLFEQFRRQTF